jgi:hypothetical protein
LIFGSRLEGQTPKHIRTPFVLNIIDLKFKYFKTNEILPLKLRKAATTYNDKRKDFKSTSLFFSYDITIVQVNRRFEVEGIMAKKSGDTGTEKSSNREDNSKSHNSHSKNDRSEVNGIASHFQPPTPKPTGSKKKSK